jgi:MFS family permease
MAATLLILRATELLTPGGGATDATTTAIALYVGYNVSATIFSIPAGRLVDARGARPVFALGVALFALAYVLFATSGPQVVALAVGFIAAGLGIGAVETAEHAAVATMAPERLRGSAFGLLAGIQSIGDFAASALVGLVWTLVSPQAAFGLAALLMVSSLGTLVSLRPAHGPPAGPRPR